MQASRISSYPPRCVSLFTLEFPPRVRHTRTAGSFQTSIQTCSCGLRIITPTCINRGFILELKSLSPVTKRGVVHVRDKRDLVKRGARRDKSSQTNSVDFTLSWGVFAANPLRLSTLRASTVHIWRAKIMLTFTLLGLVKAASVRKEAGQMIP